MKYWKNKIKLYLYSDVTNKCFLFDRVTDKVGFAEN